MLIEDLQANFTVNGSDQIVSVKTFNGTIVATIAGITGTKAQFNTAVTDGNFLYVGDVVGVTDGDKGDLTVSASGATWTIDNDAVTYAKMQNVAGFSVVGKTATGAGDAADITAADETVLGRTGAGNLVFAQIATGQIANAAVTAAKMVNAGVHTGDSTSTFPAITLSNNVVSDAKLRDSAGFSVIGKATTGTGDPADIVAGDETVLGRTAAGNVAFAQVATGQIANAAVTLAKMANMNTDRLLGRDTAGIGVPEEVRAQGGIEFTGSAIEISAFTGDVTKALGGTSQTIANDVVTYAKMQNVSAISRLLGRGSAGGSGDPEEITLGTNLSMSGTTLNATGGGGSSATTVETNLGSTAKSNGKFTITDAAISASSKVLCWQAPGAYTGKGTRADEAEMQPVSVIAVEPASGSAVVKWQTPPMIVESMLETRSSPLGGGTAANSGTNRDRQTTARRIGKVRGNVKFSYMILA